MSISCRCDSTLPVMHSVLPSRAFTHFLALSNTAENHHRIRRLRQRLVDSEYAISSKVDSTAGSISALLSTKTATAEELYDALCSQTVEIVLTGNVGVEF